MSLLRLRWTGRFCSRFSSSGEAPSSFVAHVVSAETVAAAKAADEAPAIWQS